MSTNTPSSVLIDTLEEQHIDYELLPHSRTLSAADEARAVGVDPGHVAKTLVLATETGFVRAILSASERVDLRKVKAALGSGDVQLASEEVLAGAYPQFELGAVPPVGGPDHDLVLMDERLRDEESVVFEDGTHERSVRMKTADLVSVAGARIADIRQD
jgi:Ala-tRNA(Pro) deacylase